MQHLAGAILSRHCRTWEGGRWLAGGTVLSQLSSLLLSPRQENWGKNTLAEIFNDVKVAKGRRRSRCSLAPDNLVSTRSTVHVAQVRKLQASPRPGGRRGREGGPQSNNYHMFGCSPTTLCKLQDKPGRGQLGTCYLHRESCQFDLSCTVPHGTVLNGLGVRILTVLLCAFR